MSDDTIYVSPPTGVPEFARLELDLYLALCRAVEERRDVVLLPWRTPSKHRNDGSEAPHPSPPSRAADGLRIFAPARSNHNG